MALDAPTSALVAQAAAAGNPPLYELSPEAARAQSGAMRDVIGPGPEMDRVAEYELPALGGGSFRIRVLMPVANPPAMIVFYHGGGWVIGDIDGYDTVGRELAAASGCAVTLVDYRKAPEHPFPAAVDDSWTALQWVDAHLEELVGARVPVIVAGDSAGGNLAAVMTLRARDRSGPAIAFQALVYPVTDCDLDNASYLDPENQVLLRKDTMIWFWNHYVADAGQRKDPEISPSQADSLVGLPPAVVVTAEHDVLRDEGEAYAAALEKAGVPVTFRRFTGQIHGFFTMVNILPGSADAIHYLADSIKNFLGAGAR